MASKIEEFLDKAENDTTWDECWVYEYKDDVLALAHYGKDFENLAYLILNEPDLIDMDSVREKYEAYQKTINEVK